MPTFGVGRGGYYAIESLRLEKGYRAFGRELTPSENPVEAGLLFACKLNSDIAFLGREARREGQGARGRAANSSGSASTRPEAMLWGGELILRDGAVAGQVTSAAWGETTGSCVGLAYREGRRRRGHQRRLDQSRGSTRSMSVGVLHPVSVSLRPLYDPTNGRIRP